jgi:hypothetical protein
MPLGTIARPVVAVELQAAFAAMIGEYLVGRIAGGLGPVAGVPKV